MSTTYYKPGTWNAACDRCGRKFKADELRLTWDGLRVCASHWQPRHPQERIRPVKDNQSVPWSRPWPRGGEEADDNEFAYLDEPQGYPR